MKASWEAFVAEARTKSPSVVAVISCYGTNELIHSAQVVLQWPDERIEYERSFHLLDRTMDQITDEIIEEVISISKNVQLMFVDKPLPVDHCPCCGKGLSRTIKPAIVQRHTNPEWKNHSIGSIYINPDIPSLALLISFEEETVLTSSLHLCKGTHLHFESEFFEERLLLRAGVTVRDQVRRLVHSVITEWGPGQVLIGTDNPDQPELIETFELPEIWETNAHQSRSIPGSADISSNYDHGKSLTRSVEPC